MIDRDTSCASLWTQSVLTNPFIWLINVYFRHSGCAGAPIDTFIPPLVHYPWQLRSLLTPHPILHAVIHWLIIDHFSRLQVMNGLHWIMSVNFVWVATGGFPVPLYMYADTNEAICSNTQYQGWRVWFPPVVIQYCPCLLSRDGYMVEQIQGMLN